MITKGQVAMAHGLGTSPCITLSYLASSRLVSRRVASSRPILHRLVSCPPLPSSELKTDHWIGGWPHEVITRRGDVDVGV
jgi:hypothetical protein